MSNFRGGGGSKMTPKNWIIEGKNRITGEGGSKMTQQNRTSFMHDPLHKLQYLNGSLFSFLIGVPDLNNLISFL